jgi:hypothetical protein
VSMRSRIRSSVCLAVRTVGLKDVTDGATLCSTCKCFDLTCGERRVTDGVAQERAIRSIDLGDEATAAAS